MILNLFLTIRYFTNHAYVNKTTCQEYCLGENGHLGATSVYYQTQKIFVWFKFTAHIMGDIGFDRLEKIENCFGSHLEVPTNKIRHTFQLFASNKTFERSGYRTMRSKKLSLEKNRV